MRVEIDLEAADLVGFLDQMQAQVPTVEKWCLVCEMQPNGVMDCKLVPCPESDESD